MGRFRRQTIVFLVVLQSALAPVGAFAIACVSDAIAYEGDVVVQSSPENICDECPVGDCDFQMCGMYCGAALLAPATPVVDGAVVGQPAPVLRTAVLQNPVYTPLNPPPIR